MHNWINQNEGNILRGKNQEKLFVFRWAVLSEYQKTNLVEYQLMALGKKLMSEGNKIGDILDNELVPFALLNPEQGLEPDELLDFDGQGDGVLFIKNKKVLRCPESYSEELEEYADSIEKIIDIFSK